MAVNDRGPTIERPGQSVRGEPTTAPPPRSDHGSGPEQLGGTYPHLHAALLAQLTRNWDRGDHAANSELVAEIRQVMRQHQQAIEAAPTPKPLANTEWLGLRTAPQPRTPQHP